MSNLILAFLFCYSIMHKYFINDIWGKGIRNWMDFMMKQQISKLILFFDCFLKQINYKENINK